MVPGLEERVFRSFDGTEIAYRVRGEGPCVVLSNGLGGTHEVFRPIYALLGTRCRILSWDYRGLHRSGAVRDRRTLALTYHCHDLALLLDHEGVERALFVGWSMGVQVALEFFREHRRRMAGIVAVCGADGLPFRGALPWRVVRSLIPPTLAFMKAESAPLGRVTRGALAWRGLLPALKRAGLLGERVDEESFLAVAAGFRTVDFSAYSDMLRHLGAHDARDLLAAIDVPTLLLAGGRDRFVPVHAIRRMNRRIQGSRLVVAPDATHFLPLERPELVQDELSAFLSGVPGWAVGARA